MFPGHITNISIRSLLLQCFVSKAGGRCGNWFREYSGKRYILLTSSCRSALYLAYAAAQPSGEAITSPMTCTSALDPLLLSGTDIKFIDIDPQSLLMNINGMERFIDKHTRFIHAVHHGGLMLDTQKLAILAKQHNLMLMEDCAQAFGASHNEVMAGVKGDVACFSLIKNGYGIGGGVLATDHHDLYMRAQEIQNSWVPFSRKLLWFRIVRSILENKRIYALGEWGFKGVMRLRGNVDSNVSGEIIADKIQRRPSSLFFRLFMVQQRKFRVWHPRRRMRAQKFASMLAPLGITVISPSEDGVVSSFDKLFCYHPHFDVKKHVPRLLQMGIEARHLENRFGAIRQPRMDEMIRFQHVKGLDQCPHYFDIHDKIILLPLHEKLDDRDINTMLLALKQILKDESTD